MRKLLILSVLLGCSVDVGKEASTLVNGESPVVVDKETQKVTLDASRVPVVESCGAGLWVRRNAAGAAWECAEPEVPWSSVTGAPPFAPASHSHESLEDLVAELQTRLGAADTDAPPLAEQVAALLAQVGDADSAQPPLGEQVSGLSEEVAIIRAQLDAETGGPALGPQLADMQSEIAALRSLLQQLAGQSGGGDQASDTVTPLVPPGTVAAYGGGVAPSGWLLCDGAAVSRTTYANLFAAIGTKYGAGDGSSTFNLPDLRGCFPLGKDDMGEAAANRVTAAQADDLGLGSGEENHTLTVAEMPAHSHIPRRAINSNGSALNIAKEINMDKNSTLETLGVETTEAGGSGAHNNMPPYQTVNYIVKL